MSNTTVTNTTNQSNSQRKEEHLNVLLDKCVSFKGVATGLENYHFVHQALPEIDLATVDTAACLFGKKVNAPLVISSMVGGIEAAARINRNLAQAAQALGLAMGIGSQRCSFDDPETAQTYQVREVAPDILLFANLGAVQLNYGYGVDECQRAIDDIGADAIILHLNPLQESLQFEGNTNFAGLLTKIEQVCVNLPVPVIVKEVGCGISEEVASKLAEAGVVGIDVAGAGGTSWSEVERYRSPSEQANNIAATFASWGIPTTESIEMARRGAPDLTLIASGGISTGLDVAKAIALGTDAAGIAAPLLKAANVSLETVKATLQEVIAELKISMFCIGAASLRELKNSPFLKRRTRD